MQPIVAFPETDGLARHLPAIQSLSEKHRVPVGIVAELYVGEWDVLLKKVRLTHYLSVFVSRRVSERLNTLEPDAPYLET